jgi:hypothetical protein
MGGGELKPDHRYFFYQSNASTEDKGSETYDNNHNGFAGNNTDSRNPYIQTNRF